VVTPSGQILEIGLPTQQTVAGEEDPIVGGVDPELELGWGTVFPLKGEEDPELGLGWGTLFPVKGLVDPLFGEGFVSGSGEGEGDCWIVQLKNKTKKRKSTVLM
jgi:hypothetical protein